MSSNSIFINTKRFFLVFFELLISNFYAHFIVGIFLVVLSFLFFRPDYTLIFLVGIVFGLGFSLPSLIIVGFPVALLMCALKIEYRAHWLLVGALTAVPSLYVTKFLLSALHKDLINPMDLELFTPIFLIMPMSIMIGIVTASFFHARIYKMKEFS